MTTGNFEKTLKDSQNIKVHVSPQTCGSAELNYRGIDESVRTISSTIVLSTFYTNIAGKHFGGNGLTYETKNPAKTFQADLYNRDLVNYYKSDKYIKKD